MNPTGSYLPGKCSVAHSCICRVYVVVKDTVKIWDAVILDHKTWSWIRIIGVLTGKKRLEATQEHAYNPQSKSGTQLLFQSKLGTWRSEQNRHLYWIRKQWGSKFFCFILFCFVPFRLHLGKIRKLAVHWEIESSPADAMRAHSFFSISVP